jgi:hypothetical protein
MGMPLALPSSATLLGSGCALQVLAPPAGQRCCGLSASIPHAGSLYNYQVTALAIAAKTEVACGQTVVAESAGPSPAQQWKRIFFIVLLILFRRQEGQRQLSLKFEV